VLEHRVGATGAIGMEAVARAQPDGYTITITAAPSVVAVPALRTLPYKPFEDLAPVGRIALLGLVVAVNPALGVNSFKELVDAAKRQPGKLHTGTAGIGSLAHFTNVYLNQTAGMDIVAVPYRGSAEAMNDMLAGHVQAFHDGIVLPHVKAGKAKLLVYIDDQRHPDHPDVPTMKEIYPDWPIYAWFGTMVPAATPKAIIDRLSAALNEIAASSEMKEKLQPFALRPITDSPESMRALILREAAIYRDLAQKYAIKVE
jgi:tripartite-type tricarboxylate transporter receptor subunit TctC